MRVVLGSGALMTFVSEFILFPTYIFTVFSLLRKKFVTQFTRMRIGMVVGFLGVASLFIIDIVGHSMKTSRTNVSNHSQCMFQMHRSGSMLTYPSLNMHRSVLIPLNLLLGIGPLIIITTTYEFISAQSPQSMDYWSLLCHQRSLSVPQFHYHHSLFPQHLWASEEMLEHPPVTNCGFVYLLFTCVVGLIGLILFSVAAKKYKYRRRNEGMFCQQDVEEIYDCYLSEAPVNSFDED